MSVVSINVCGYFIYLYGCWVISSFFLSIHVSMAGVLYTTVSCIQSMLYTCIHGRGLNILSVLLSHWASSRLGVLVDNGTQARSLQMQPTWKISMACY